MSMKPHRHAAAVAAALLATLALGACSKSEPAPAPKATTSLEEINRRNAENWKAMQESIKSIPIGKPQPPTAFDKL